MVLLLFVTTIEGFCNCCFVVSYFVSIPVLNHPDVEKRAGCFALPVFMVSRDCCVALPRGTTGLSAVCDCGIS